MTLLPKRGLPTIPLFQFSILFLLKFLKSTLLLRMVLAVSAHVMMRIKSAVSTRRLLVKLLISILAEAVVVVDA